MFDLIACCMQLGSDKDWSLVFAVFDENKSWYMKENTHNQTLTSCNDTDADIYDSNVIYSKFTSPTTSSVEIVYSHFHRTVTNPVKREGLVMNSAAYQQRTVGIPFVHPYIYLSRFICARIFSSRCERHHVSQASVCHLSNGRRLLARR